jgi:hypothetical protein
VFGPFIGEIDARAYALDFFQEEEGLESVVPMQLEHEQAESFATEKVIWPYEEEDEDKD